MNDNPISPTEMALRWRIKELEAKLYYLERHYEIGIMSNPKPVELEFDRLPNTLTIQKRAELYANVLPSGGVQVKVTDTSNDKEYRVAYYIDQSLAMSYTNTLDLMAKLHYNVLHNLAKFVDKEMK